MLSFSLNLNLTFSLLLSGLSQSQATLQVQVLPPSGAETTNIQWIPHPFLALTVTLLTSDQEDA